MWNWIEDDQYYRENFNFNMDYSIRDCSVVFAKFLKRKIWPVSLSAKANLFETNEKSLKEKKTQFPYFHFSCKRNLMRKTEMNDSINGNERKETKNLWAKAKID